MTAEDPIYFVGIDQELGIPNVFGLPEPALLCTTPAVCNEFPKDGSPRQHRGGCMGLFQRIPATELVLLCCRFDPKDPRSATTAILGGTKRSDIRRQSMSDPRRHRRDSVEFAISDFSDQHQAQRDKWILDARVAPTAVLRTLQEVPQATRAQLLTDSLFSEWWDARQKYPEIVQQQNRYLIGKEVHLQHYEHGLDALLEGFCRVYLSEALPEAPATSDESSSPDDQTSEAPNVPQRSVMSTHIKEYRAALHDAYLQVSFGVTQFLNRLNLSSYSGREEYRKATAAMEEVQERLKPLIQSGLDSCELLWNTVHTIDPDYGEDALTEALRGYRDSLTEVKDGMASVHTAIRQADTPIRLAEQEAEDRRTGERKTDSDLD
jgi:hypothetical protein